MGLFDSNRPADPPSEGARFSKFTEAVKSFDEANVPVGKGLVLSHGEFKSKPHSTATAMRKAIREYYKCEYADAPIRVKVDGEDVWLIQK